MRGAACHACASRQALLSRVAVLAQINAKSARMVEGRQQILRVGCSWLGISAHAVWMLGVCEDEAGVQPVDLTCSSHSC